MRSKIRFALCLILVTGCQSSNRESRSFITPSRGTAKLERLAFWRELTDRPVAGNDDAFHAVLLALDGDDPNADYAARVAALKTRGLLPSDFAAAAGDPIRRGTLAYTIANRLGLKGGLTTRLLGNSPRYALKELEFRGLIPTSSPNQALSGNELVGVISKAVDYRATGTADVSAVVGKPEGHTREFEDVVEAADPPDTAWLADVAPAQLSLTQPIYATMMQQTQPATGPTTAAAADGPFDATVEALEGDADWKPNEAAEWRLVKVGDILNQDAIVETGPAAKVTLRMPSGQSLIIYQLTDITLLELRRRGGTVKTDIGLKHGRTEYEIYGAGVRYDAKVRSPNTTLAVRSTRVLLYEQAPFTPEAVSLVGRTDFIRKVDGNTISLGGRTGKVKARADRNSAADTALAAAVVDPSIANARTVSEQELIGNLISRGATLSFDPIANIPVLTGGSHPSSTRAVARTLPGTLTFVLTWDQPANQPRANIDLLVSNRSGDILLPTGAFSLSKNLGREFFDHRGGDLGGIEYASFPATYPRDLYYVAAVATSGSAPVRLRAFLNGQPLQISDQGVPIPGGQQFKIEEDADATNNPFGLVFANPAFTGPLPASTRQRATKPQPPPPAPKPAVRKK